MVSGAGLVDLFSGATGVEVELEAGVQLRAEQLPARPLHPLLRRSQPSQLAALELAMPKSEAGPRDFQFPRQRGERLAALHQQRRISFLLYGKAAIISDPPHFWRCDVGSSGLAW